MLCVLNNVLKILNGAIDKYAFLPDAGDGRDEWIRTGRHDDPVVRDLNTATADDCFAVSVDRARSVSQVQLNSNAFVPFTPCQHQLLGVSMREERSETHSVVCCTWFFAECDNPVSTIQVVFDQPLTETKTDHAVTDNDDRFRFVRSIAFDAHHNARVQRVHSRKSNGRAIRRFHVALHFAIAQYAGDCHRSANQALTSVLCGLWQVRGLRCALIMHRLDGVAKYLRKAWQSTIHLGRGNSSAGAIAARTDGEQCWAVYECLRESQRRSEIRMFFCRPWVQQR